MKSFVLSQKIVGAVGKISEFSGTLQLGPCKRVWLTSLGDYRGECTFII